MRILRWLALCCGAITLGGCSTLFASVGAQPLAGAQTGNFANLEVDNFKNPNFDINDNNYAEQASIDAALTQSGWNDTDKARDGSVTAQNFLNAATNDDILFYSGHGFPGDLLLYGFNEPNYTADQSEIGVGSTSGSSCCGDPDPANAHILNGRLKWLVWSASDSVAPDTNMDPGDSPNWTVNAGAWSGVFGSGGSLRAIYGYWQPPGVCSPLTGGHGTEDPTRVCDIGIPDSNAAMQQFLTKIWSADGSQNVETLHAAWIDANIASNDMDQWAILEDCNATSDIFSSNPEAVGDGQLSGSLCYNYPLQNVASLQQLSSIPHTTFTLQPMTLTRPSLNVAGLVQTAEKDINLGTVTTIDDGAVRTYASQAGIRAQYYYNLSGGADFDGTPYTFTVSFSQATAQQAAETFIQNSWGMPQDASLSEVDGIYRSTGSSRTLIGYIFVWRHNSGAVLGGDYMTVTVDDHMTMQCVKWGVVNGKPYCEQWQANHTPAILQGYYLWRTVTGPVQQYSEGGKQTGDQSVDAYTASLSLGSNPIAGYASGYWTNYINKSDNMAYPVWLFTLTNGQVMAVDAYTGKRI